MYMRFSPSLYTRKGRILFNQRWRIIGRELANSGFEGLFGQKHVENNVMIIIKRYPNRKLYNTEAKQYITLEGVADLIRQGAEIQVVDHASGEDLTAVTLTQIILEQEKKQSGLLTNSFLTGLIRAGSDRLSAFQRSLASPASFWHQIDEEIKNRIQALVHQGEISEKEARNLIDKMIQQGARQINRMAAMDEATLENYLRQRQLPTQEDLDRLQAQIEELTHKIEEITLTNKE
jgi:polyhydroxyalkanoate synthesis repressor PhaR